jgi:hypothetical protein
MGGVDGGGPASRECRLGEAEPTVNADGSWSFCGDDGLDGSVNPTGFQLSTVTRQVVETTDPIVVGFCDPYGMGHAGCHAGSGSVVDQRSGRNHFDLIEVD